MGLKRSSSCSELVVSGLAFLKLTSFAPCPNEWAPFFFLLRPAKGLLALPGSSPGLRGEARAPPFSDSVFQCVTRLSQEKPRSVGKLWYTFEPARPGSIPKMAGGALVQGPLPPEVCARAWPISPCTAGCPCQKDRALRPAVLCL